MFRLLCLAVDQCMGPFITLSNELKSDFTGILPPIYYYNSSSSSSSSYYYYYYYYYLSFDTHTLLYNLRHTPGSYNVAGPIYANMEWN